eukprot:m.893278 g.893278  ORF g.893278 m.893278 type:complete len:389 (+) comp23659_c1_seq1:208-1374(+)
MSCPFSSRGAREKDAPKDAEGKIAPNLPSGVTPIGYHEYLKLDEILGAQSLRSELYNKPAHDEMLFIIVHQVYELWFKQALHEIDSIRGLFQRKSSMADETSMLTIQQRLNRVVEILKLCVAQFNLLLTMSPMDFESFRAFLIPASGFQSLQFRLFENRLGIRPAQRIKYHNDDYKESLAPEQMERARASETEPSLLDLVEHWLERTPGVNTAWWSELEQNVIAHQAQVREAAAAIEDKVLRESELENCTVAEATFKEFFDPEVHGQKVARGQRRMSHEGLKGALLIFWFRDLPRFQIPFNMLTALQDIDTQLLEWRHKHATMVQRMIGSKMGTGGSSGYMYLRSTVSDRYKVFLDIANLSTYLVPRHLVPALDVTTTWLLHHPTETS